jgi:hypothetical protein
VNGRAGLAALKRLSGNQARSTNDQTDSNAKKRNDRNKPMGRFDHFLVLR